MFLKDIIRRRERRRGRRRSRESENSGPGLGSTSPFLRRKSDSIIISSKEDRYIRPLTLKWRQQCKSRKENPQKLTQLSSRSHPRHLVGKRTAQKDITIDTTSDSQVNSNFPNRWSPASLTFNNYFYLFLYLYIT